MTKETETFVVAEGTTALDGKAVKAGKRLQMTLAEALYHQSLGRIERPASQRKKPAATTDDGDSDEGEAS